MGHYDRYAKRPARDHPYEIHPIWRGIGCLLIIIIPIVAYAGAYVLVALNLQNAWFNMPRDLAKTEYLPVINIPVEHLYGNLLVGAVLTILGFGLLMIFYAIISNLMGPPRYGPTDAPPIRRHPNKRKRR